MRRAVLCGCGHRVEVSNQEGPSGEVQASVTAQALFSLFIHPSAWKGALRISGVGGSRRFEVTKGAEALVRAPTIRPDSPSYFGTVDRCIGEVALGALLGTPVIRRFLRYVLPR